MIGVNFFQQLLYIGIESKPKGNEALSNGSEQLRRIFWDMCESIDPKTLQRENVAVPRFVRLARRDELHISCLRGQNLQGLHDINLHHLRVSCSIRVFFFSSWENDRGI